MISAKGVVSGKEPKEWFWLLLLFWTWNLSEGTKRMWNKNIDDDLRWKNAFNDLFSCSYHCMSIQSNLSLRHSPNTDHLCLQQPLVLGTGFYFYNWTMTNVLGFRGWLLYTGSAADVELTVVSSLSLNTKENYNSFWICKPETNNNIVINSNRFENNANDNNNNNKMTCVCHDAPLDVNYEFIGELIFWPKHFQML